MIDPLSHIYGPFTSVSRRMPPLLPTAIVSDSFNRAALGSTDGAGSSWLGGSGLSWAQQVGTWAIASNRLRAATVVSANAIATVDAGTPNVSVTAKIKILAGAYNAGVVARYVDPDNYVFAYITQSTGAVVLKKKVGGVASAALTTATATYADDAELTLIANGASFSVYYNGIQYGSTVTIDDAALQSGTAIGLYTNTASSNINSDAFYAFSLAEPAPFTNRRVVRVTREDANNLLVRVPIAGESPRIVAEWRLRKITTALAGWAAPSNCWHLLGLRVVDLDGIAAPVILCAPATSAFEYAFAIGLAEDAQVDYDYAGAIHQAQASTAATFALNGFDLSTLPVSVTAYGSRFTVAQAMNTVLPKDKTTVIGASSLIHTFTPQILDIAHSHTFTAGHALYSFYSAMLPTTNADAAGADRYQVGNESVGSRAADDSVNNLNTLATLVQMWHSAAHPYRVRMSLPTGGPDDAADWTPSGNYKCWVHDRADGVLKAYVNFITSDYADRAAAGPSSHHTQYAIHKV